MTLVLFIQLIIFQPSFAFQNFSIGDSISNFSCKDLNGEVYHYSDFKDKKLLFVFMSCANCDSTIDLLESLNQEYSQLTSDNFEVVVVFESNHTEAWEKLINRSYPFILTTKSQISIKTSRNGELVEDSKTPTELIVRKGRVVETHYGKDENDFLPFYRVNQF
jgi:peroxiredoxin